MRKRNLLVRGVKTALFWALLIGSVALASRIVERKASVVKLRDFLDAPEAYDVLFMGDSHMVNAVFPMELWQDYGIAAYNAACYGNTLPVSYWALMNALDYADPRVVVIDVKDIEKSYKLSGSSGDLHTALDAYPLSLTKWRALEDLMDDPYAQDDDGDYYVDLKWEYVFKLGKYHSRWSELQRADFFVEPNCQKGAEMIVGVAEPNAYERVDPRQSLEVQGVGYDYLRRMIAACQSRGITVLLVHLPYPSTQEEQEAANAVRDVAQECGVDFVDFVALDRVVDYRTDCYDAFSHLNPSGARKVTDYLGDYIAGYYGVPDRRNDADYASWADDYARYAAFKLNLLRDAPDAKSALMLLHDAHLSAAVSVAADSPLYEDEELLRLMQNIAREHVYETDGDGKRADALFPLERLDRAAEGNAPYLLLVDRGLDRVGEFVGEGSGTLKASFGDLLYRCDEAGASLCMGDADLLGEAADLRIAAFDPVTGKVTTLRFDL